LLPAPWYHPAAPHERVARACGIAPEDGDWYSPELAFDLAVGEMEAAGLVETEDLEQALADGEPDYRIRMTREGAAFAREGKSHHSPGHEL
jgi:hypothetical protein